MSESIRELNSRFPAAFSPTNVRDVCLMFSSVHELFRIDGGTVTAGVLGQCGLNPDEIHVSRYSLAM